MPPSRRSSRKAPAAAAEPTSGASASATPAASAPSRKRKRATSRAPAKKAPVAEEAFEEEEEEEDEAMQDAEADEEDEGELEFSGTKDKKGNWLTGTLTCSDSKRVHYTGAFKDGMKHGEGEMFFPDGSSLKGNFVEDEVNGLATYHGADGSRITGTYVEGGVLCGEVFEYDDDGQETFHGQYVDSQRHGYGVVTQPDGGRLEGEFVHGVFSGPQNKYIYPAGLGEGHAELRGAWEEGVMKRAQFYLGGKLVDPKVWYEHDESTATVIATDVHQSDPYELRCVYVKDSTTPHSGEGLFALRDLPADCIVTWYNGTRDKGWKAERRKWSENSNTISLIDDDPEGADIDIDVEEKWSTTDKYKASLAHKCNHTFDPAKLNAKYDMALHPRFGLIKSIRTLRPVPRDEELFVDYGYAVKKNKKGETVGTQGPEWYRAAWELQRKSSDASSSAAAASSSTQAKPASKRAKK